MSTLRKEIAEALEGESLDLREISKLFGIKEKEVLDHLRKRTTGSGLNIQQTGFFRERLPELHKKDWNLGKGTTDVVKLFKKLSSIRKLVL